MNFADRLYEAIARKKNPTVLGLDPELSYVPPVLLTDCAAERDGAELLTEKMLVAFNRRLIDALADIIPAVKLQSAFYEQYGPAGLAAMRQTIEHARRRELLVIVDAKRNDIGSTAAAYARTYLTGTALADGTHQIPFPADALTLNAYLGLDGIQPFLDGCRDENKGVFILVRTSNPSAGDLQDLKLHDGRLVCEAMADLVEQWGRDLIGRCGYSSVGAVVGATWPDQAAGLRRRMPHAWMLVPGYGAQGASADDAVAGFGPDGCGGLVNASRSLMLAWKKQGMAPGQFDLAARQEAIAMQQALQAALDRRYGSVV